MVTARAQAQDQEKSRIISTGANEFDKKMGGGIPLGSLTLIEGQSGAGKSTLGQSLITGALHDGVRSVIYTTENTTRSLLRQMETLGLDLKDYYLLDQLRIYSFKVDEMDMKPGEAFQALTRHIESLQDYDVVLLDSLSTLLTTATEDEILFFFSRCKALCDRGKTIICTAHAHAFDERVLTRVRSLCDAHFKLIVESGASELVKSMEVAKVRGADMGTGSIISFAIEPGIGMRIIPVSKAKA
jgi:flagellar protein FlaH